MAHVLTPPLARRLRRLVAPDAAGTADAALLDRYVTVGDEDAFEAIVRRHGPMVYGVCRRLLSDPHDAEDAFQATFLVLVRKAAAVSPPWMLPGWLHGVARRTALRARAAAATRWRRETTVAELPEVATRRTSPEPDLRPMLDEELARLPAKYREAVVTCDLQGLSHKQAAVRLGWPVGTLASRHSRGRAMLASRLARRGVEASPAAAMMPPALLAATLRAATLFEAGQPVSGSAIPLAQGVLNAMSLHTYRAAACVLAVVLTLGGVVGLTIPRPAATAAAPPAPARALSLREAATGALRTAGLRVTEAGGERRIAHRSAVGLEAERVAAQALLNAEVAYWNLYAARRQLACRERALADIEATLPACEERRAAVQQVREERRQAAERAAEAERQLRLLTGLTAAEAERQLRLLTGLTAKDCPAFNLSDTPSTAAARPDRNAALKEAMADRVELQMSRDQVKLSQTLVLIDKLLTATVTRPSFLPNDPRVQLAWDIEVLKDQEVKVVKYLDAHYHWLTLHHDKFKVSKARREAAEEQLRSHRTQPLAGPGQVATLLEAHRTWSDVSSDEVQSLVSFINSLAAFEFAKGASLRRHNVVLEKP